MTIRLDSALRLIEVDVVYPNEFWIDWLRNFLLIRNHVRYFNTHREGQRLAWVVTCEPDHNGVLADFMWMTEIFIDAETGRIIGGWGMIGIN